LVLAAARAMASDLHLHPGYPLMIRQHGRIVQSPTAPLAAESLEPALKELLSDEERATWAARGQVATTFVVSNVARCRLTLVKTAAGPSAVFRLIPLVAPNLSSLGLPTTLARFVAGGGGLVLVAGPASCGKTWTLAALVDIVNSERREHIVCVERPIEFVHLPKRCVVSQREVPTQARDISRAVRAALHEDADVLVLGEVEDPETLRLAITAAEGGKLVLATVASNSTARALARLVGMFPADQQAQAASMLAGALRGVVAQRLVPSADGSRRLPVCEMMEIDAKTEASLVAGRLSDLAPTVTFDQSLTDAVKAGRITREDARRHADQTGLFS
ncbi:MAG TPA: ATPase, T2SS/T4P/T4SS family, partial [bacterium]|nr:ATPase, T2SS/T4P/T4SS family [bacterium]